MHNPKVKIKVDGNFIFLLNFILINSVSKYNVENIKVYKTIGLKYREDIISKCKRAVRALVPPHAGQKNPK